MNHHSPSCCCTRMPVTGRGLCADATDAVPPEGGCVEKVHIIVECTLQNRSSQGKQTRLFPWCLCLKNMHLMVGPLLLNYE